MKRRKLLAKKIFFIPQDTFVSQPWGEKVEISLPAPSPASKFVPDWYNKSERWLRSDGPVIENYSANQGVKHCIPFLESMTSGYMLTLWTDVQVKLNPDGTPYFNWMSQPDPIVVRDQESGSLIPRPAGHNSLHLAWVGQWAIKLPKGYSFTLTHPVNRFDLPFTTLTGIIDGDSFHPTGLIPFFIKDGFEGIIKEGTPIAQILPFKRDDWQSELGGDSLRQEVIQQAYDSRRHVGGLYKKSHWSRKKFQ